MMGRNDPFYFGMTSGAVKYMPLEAVAGDLAVYLQRNAWEIEFNKEKYVIVPHQAILLLVRDED